MGRRGAAGWWGAARPSESDGRVGGVLAGWLRIEMPPELAAPLAGEGGGRRRIEKQALHCQEANSPEAAGGTTLHRSPPPTAATNPASSDLPPSTSLMLLVFLPLLLLQQALSKKSLGTL